MTLVDGGGGVLLMIDDVVINLLLIGDGIELIMTVTKGIVIVDNCWAGDDWYCWWASDDPIIGGLLWRNIGDIDDVSEALLTIVGGGDLLVKLLTLLLRTGDDVGDGPNCDWPEGDWACWWASNWWWWRID